MGKKPFTIVFEKSWFEVNDTLNKHYKVVKVYDKIWWRRLLRWFGFKIAIDYRIDVKYKDNE